MGVVITPESPLGIELAKWNAPRVHTEFPRMLYMARKRSDGVMSIGETDDRLFGGQPGSAEAFTSTCQMTVGSEGEMNRFLEMGWRSTPHEAVARFASKEKHISDAAAHRAYEDRNLGEKAQAEVAAYEASVEEHVAEMPEKRKAGRPRKTA